MALSNEEVFQELEEEVRNIYRLHHYHMEDAKWKLKPEEVRAWVKINKFLEMVEDDIRGSRGWIEWSKLEDETRAPTTDFDMKSLLKELEAPEFRDSEGRPLMIPMIKHVRAVSGLGLFMSKAAVEDWRESCGLWTKIPDNSYTGYSWVWHEHEPEFLYVRLYGDHLKPEGICYRYPAQRAREIYNDYREDGLYQRTEILEVAPDDCEIIDWETGEVLQEI